jgi:hypothetical protein
VTYRMDAKNDGGAVVLELQGLLDRKALAEIRTHCASRVLRGLSVRLVLRLGTELEAGCLEELAGLQGVELIAEAPFLRRWLEGRRSEPL